MLVIEKNDEVKFDKFPKTNEEYISVSYCCTRFIDCCKFLSSSLGSLVKTLDEDDCEISKEQFPDKWEYII